MQPWLPHEICPVAPIHLLWLPVLPPSLRGTVAATARWSLEAGAQPLAADLSIALHAHFSILTPLVWMPLLPVKHAWDFSEILPLVGYIVKKGMRQKEL